jgi:hypothetical protein
MKPTLSVGKPRDPGPHGITRLMLHLGRTAPIQPRGTRERDRSLAGKARIRARRLARRSTVELYTCPNCGHRMGIAGVSNGSWADLDADRYFDEEVERHESGDCIRAEVAS